MASLAVPASILAAAAEDAINDEDAAAPATTKPAVKEAPPMFPPGTARPQEIPLVPGAQVNINAHGDRGEIWSDGPIHARADDMISQSHPHAGARLRFERGARRVQVLPTSCSATKVFIIKMTR